MFLCFFNPILPWYFYTCAQPKRRASTWGCYGPARFVPPPPSKCRAGTVECWPVTAFGHSLFSFFITRFHKVVIDASRIWCEIRKYCTTSSPNHINTVKRVEECTCDAINSPLCNWQIDKSALVSLFLACTDRVVFLRVSQLIPSAVVRDTHQWDPYVFWSPGSTCVSHKCGAGSGSFLCQEKIVIKPGFLLFWDFFMTFYLWRFMWMYPCTGSGSASGSGFAGSVCYWGSRIRIR